MSSYLSALTVMLRVLPKHPVLAWQGFFGRKTASE
jgi:hypothetical protein